jgi:hypothetical protein
MINNSPKDIFKGKKEYPFHLSVGAVLVNENGEICCHFYKKGDLDHESEGRSDLYLLMRETPNINERILDTLERGLMEEFGAEGEVVHFLGSVDSWFPGITTGVKLNKTTLYFLVRLINFDPALREIGAVESRSEILWLEPSKLAELFREQGRKYERTDLDESQVIENYLEYARD